MSIETETERRILRRDPHPTWCGSAAELPWVEMTEQVLRDGVIFCSLECAGVELVAGEN